MDEKRSFEKSNLILLTLSLGASVINYLLQILLGRLLSVEEFGIVNSIFSLISVLTIPGMIIAVVIAKECAAVDENKKEKLEATISELLKIVGMLILIFWCIEISCTGVLKILFKISQTELIILGIGVSLVTILVQAVYSVLQGKRQFFELGMQSLITAFFKMILSTIFVLAGGGIFSVLIAYFVAEVITLLYCMVSAKINLQCLKKTKVAIKEKWGIWKTSVSNILVLQLGIMLLSNGDILLVKAFFSDEMTGLYSAAVTFSRVPLFIALSLSNVLLPTVVTFKQQGKSTSTLLIKSLCYGSIPWGCVTLILQIFGAKVIEIVYGNSYVQATEYFGATNLYVFALIILTIIMNYAIAVEDTAFFSISITIGIIICIIAVISIKGDLNYVITLIGMVCLGIAVMNIAHLLRLRKCSANK